ncbi:hypothetical protein QZH41_007046 [Actinostola sp. cb2023]|nr:hypothetical protein QZH41_007046 [Actinostola sp. cb2023]
MKRSRYTNTYVYRCDRYDLSKGWYRFTGSAGSQIATSCVPTYRCGTYAPGWMNGSHPTPAEGIVTRNVCYHWASQCCYLNNMIRVKNCGGFYVYELDQPPGCALRYCGSNGTVEAPTTQILPTTVEAPTTQILPTTVEAPTTQILPTTVEAPTTQILPTTVEAPTTQIRPTTGNFGNFTFSMNLFRSSQYQKPYSPLDYPVSLNEPLWIQFEVKDTNADLVVFAESCRATTSINPNSLPKYVLLEQGCVRDPTMVYSHNPGSKVQRFNLKSFRFVHSNNAFVYIHYAQKVDVGMVSALAVVCGLLAIMGAALVIMKLRGKFPSLSRARPTNSTPPVAMDVTVNSYEQNAVDLDEQQMEVKI